MAEERRTLKHRHAWRQRRSVVLVLAGTGSALMVASLLGLVAGSFPLVAGILAVVAAATLAVGLINAVEFDEEGATAIGPLRQTDFLWSDVAEFEVRTVFGGTRVVAILKSGDEVRLAGLEPFLHMIAELRGRQSELRSWRTMEDAIEALERRRRRHDRVNGEASAATTF